MIALAGPNLPHEVLLAAGVHGGPLPYVPDRPVNSAREWLENKFAPWAPVVLEAWVEGEYDEFQAVLFSRADDTSQRLYYYVCELQRRGLIGGPEALIFDAAKIERQSSVDHTVAQVRALAHRLGSSDEALESAIVQGNVLRAQRAAPASGPVCLLAGSPPPDRRLHDAIVAAGFVPAGATLAEQWTELGAPVQAGTGDPAGAIGRQLHAQPEGARSFADRGKILAAAAMASGCDAVVIWQIEEDEIRSWSLPAERRALDALGLPYLVMTRRDWLAGDGAIEEIGDFLTGVAS